MPNNKKHPLLALPAAASNLLPKLEFKYVKTADLKFRKNSVRKESKKQQLQICTSIQTFGFLVPGVITRQMVIVVGEERVKAALRLGMQEVPMIYQDHLTDNQVRAFALVDNKLCKNGKDDPAKLAAELTYLMAPEVSFDLTGLGFDIAEIDLLLDNHTGNSKSAKEAADSAFLETYQPPKIAVSRLHDGWQLGRHRLWCDDARDPKAIEHLLNGEKAQMVFTDPPYNITARQIGGRGRIKHRPFPMGNGEWSEPEFIEFLTVICCNLVQFSVDGAIAYIAMDGRHLFELLSAVRATFTELKDICTWRKTNASNSGGLYRPQSEFFVVAKAGAGPYINNAGMSKHRYRSNVWTYPGANTFQVGRLEELALHATVKPLALVADCIKDASKRGGIILDCFAGSGTTIIAAEVTGRCAYTMELDPIHVDTCIRRYQAYTSEDAIHIASGQTFAERERALGGDNV